MFNLAIISQRNNKIIQVSYFTHQNDKYFLKIDTIIDIGIGIEIAGTYECNKSYQMLNFQWKQKAR